MLKAKITYREMPIEAEANTKRDLEDALEAALNVVARLNLSPLQAYREPETHGTGVIPSVPPPEATQPLGGATPPEESIEPPTKQQETRTVSYRGAETIGDHIYIALQDLAKLNGISRGYSNREIIDHLHETGSKIIKNSKSAYPIRSVGQAVRSDKHNRFVRKDELTWLSEWLVEETTPEHESQQTQPDSEETSESLSSKSLVVSGF